MLYRLIKSLFNLFIDQGEEYIEAEIKKYYDLFYNGSEYPLNRKQCEAVIQNKRFNQVIASAGTGKTTVLAFRIKYLIEEGISPDRIIAITYTKKAANEMETRLKKQFNIIDVEVRTIHSFAYKILRNESERELSIVTSIDLRKIVGRIFQQLIRKNNTFKRYYFRFFIRYYKEVYLNRKVLEDEDKLIDIILNKKDEILDEFIDFIDLAKKNNIKPENIKKLLNRDNQRQYYFGLSAAILYQNVQNYLNKTNKVDFNDMVFKAINILKKGADKYYKLYDHMLVDEFQDVSLGQIKFLKQFFKAGSNIRLFCVGDDWQSIYSFQGSEPKYFIGFERYFGKAAKTYLVDNYRCPKKILDAGNLLISNNKNQIKKEVRAKNTNDSIPTLHILENGVRYEKNLTRYILTMVKKYLRNGCRPADIMIICRYDDAVPYLNNIKKSLKKEQIPYTGKGNDYYNPNKKYQKPENAISIFSIHQSKGREAANVFLLHVVEEDQFSFPQSERETELLEPVKINKVNHLQEERRLFYVAITRASKNLHILTQSNNISPFIKEIEPFLKVKKVGSKLADVGDYISLRAKLHKLWKNKSEKIKQVGLLEDSNGSITKFLSWSTSTAPLLKDNIWYELRNVKVSKYNNRLQLILNNITEVIPLDKKVND